MDTSTIKQLCFSHGADLVGITSASKFTGAPPGHSPTDILPDCRSVIVLACEFPKEAIGETTINYTTIRNHMVGKLNELAKSIGQAIKKEGYKSKAIASTGGKWEKERFYGAISLKHAAQLAGLGKISRNGLLTNDKFGNMIWLNAVLTSLELEEDNPATYEVCNHCNICVKTCPSKALEDITLFNQKDCRKTCYKTIKGKLELKCWNCRKTCPFGMGQ